MKVVKVSHESWKTLHTLRMERDDPNVRETVAFVLEGWEKMNVVKAELRDVIGFYERNYRTTPFDEGFKSRYEWSKKMLKTLEDLP